MFARTYFSGRYFAGRYFPGAAAGLAGIAGAVVAVLPLFTAVGAGTSLPPGTAGSGAPSLPQIVSVSVGSHVPPAVNGLGVWDLPLLAAVAEGPQDLPTETTGTNLYDGALPGTWPRHVTMPSGIVRDFSIRWDRQLRYSFRPGLLVNDGFELRPRKENGFAYRALNDGYLAQYEPEWPTEVGGRVWCGSVQLENVGAQGGWDVIIASAWTSNRSANVTFSREAIVGMMTSTFVTTDLAAGERLELYNTITTRSGRTDRRTFLVEVQAE